jgi:hypothetical protein
LCRAKNDLAAMNGALEWADIEFIDGEHRAIATSGSAVVRASNPAGAVRYGSFSIYSAAIACGSAIEAVFNLLPVPIE